MIYWESRLEVRSKPITSTILLLKGIIATNILRELKLEKIETKKEIK